MSIPEPIRQAQAEADARISKAEAAIQADDPDWKEVALEALPAMREFRLAVQDYALAVLADLDAEDERFRSQLNRSQPNRRRWWQRRQRV